MLGWARRAGGEVNNGSGRGQVGIQADFRRSRAGILSSIEAKTAGSGFRAGAIRMSISCGQYCRNQAGGPLWRRAVIPDSVGLIGRSPRSCIMP